MSRSGESQRRSLREARVVVSRLRGRPSERGRGGPVLRVYILVLWSGYVCMLQEDVVG